MEFREKEFKIEFNRNDWLNLIHGLHAEGRLLEQVDEKTNQTLGFVTMKYGFDQPKNYYDTPDWDVIKRGFCWRVRPLKIAKFKKDGLMYAFKQVLKSVGRLRSDGSLDRMEYKRLLSNKHPKAERIKEEPVRAMFAEIDGLEDKLQRVFRTNTERYDVHVQVEGNGYIEMSFDKGFLETENGCIPFCLIELEAKGCSPEALRSFQKEIFNMYPNAKEIHYSHADLGYSVTLPNDDAKSLLQNRYVKTAKKLLVHPSTVIPKEFCLTRIQIPHKIKPPSLPKGEKTCDLVKPSALKHLKIAA